MFPLQPDSYKLAVIAPLIGILIHKAFENRHKQNLDIEGKTPVFNIKQIILDTLAD